MVKSAQTVFLPLRDFWAMMVAYHAVAGENPMHAVVVSGFVGYV